MKHNRPYEKCMFSQMKPMFATYFLHILQGQAWCFHTLVSFLNLKSLTVFLYFEVPWTISGSQEFDRLDGIVCCFYVFSSELAGHRTEIIVWLLKVK